MTERRYPETVEDYKAIAEAQEYKTHYYRLRFAETAAKLVFTNRVLHKILTIIEERLVNE